MGNDKNSYKSHTHSKINDESFDMNTHQKLPFLTLITTLLYQSTNLKGGGKLLFPSKMMD